MSSHRLRRVMVDDRVAGNSIADFVIIATCAAL
jgi:hypothetical protein